MTPAAGPTPARDFSRLQRPRQPLPGGIRRLLAAQGLLAAFRQRPPYQ